MNYASPKVEARDAGAKGKGVYAVAPIAAGETVVAFGGHIIESAQLHVLSPRQRSLTIQIDDDLFLMGPDPAEPGDLVNHSCDPNTGIMGNVVLIAMRAIEPGEEITFDYAMCDSTVYDEFDCACGSNACRGRVTANDWMRVELQERYAGWFSAYLARKIAAVDASPRTFAVA